MYPFFYDPTFLLLLPVFAFSIWAQYRVKQTFEKYSKVASIRGLTGRDAAAGILSASGLGNIKIENIRGELTDHYDPRSGTLRLSDSTAESRSVAAIGVAAHEAGHAIQHANGYKPFEIRQAIVPVAQFGTTLAFPLFIMGLIFTIPRLMDFGIILFTGAVVFQLVTLPVEFDASSRALKLLRNNGYLAGEENNYAKKVLDAAALTYVAATAAAVVNLIRLLILRGSRD